MGKRIVITLILALFISLGIVYFSEAFPSVSAEKAVLIHLNSGEKLYGKNESQKAYPASITKILTALVAIEEEEKLIEQKKSTGFERIISVTGSAVGVEGSSIFLQKGEKISIRDLLYGLMLRSGNDAAVALAEEYGGIDHFVMLMNKRANEIGAKSSNFMNPHGLHDENHFTTAEDMALIAAEAMKNKEFRKLAEAKSWKAESRKGTYNYFVTKNKVVHEYDGGTGIKIGFTKAAGRTLVASSKRGDVELIAVVLNASNWFNDVYSLMDAAFAQYDVVRVAKGEKTLNTIKVISGERDRVKVGLKEEALVIREKKKKSNISLVYSIPKKVEAPFTRWEEVGQLKVYKENKFLYALPLYFLEDIERNDLK